MPSQALDELLDDPEQMALKILPLRAFAAAKAKWDNSQGDGDAAARAQEDPLVQQVVQMEFEIMAEEMSAAEE